jgi:hypothetical protein
MQLHQAARVLQVIQKIWLFPHWLSLYDGWGKIDMAGMAGIPGRRHNEKYEIKVYERTHSP